MEPELLTKSQSEKSCFSKPLIGIFCVHPSPARLLRANQNKNGHLFPESLVFTDIHSVESSGELTFDWTCFLTIMKILDFILEGLADVFVTLVWITRSIRSGVSC